ncbi:MAG: hypothetical protein ACRESE_00025 [Gammaproteobacteria bacterium]
MRQFFPGALGAVLLLAVPLAHAGLSLKAIFMLSGVRGQFGQMALDVAHHRLYVTVTGSDALLVLDLNTGAVRGKITDLDQPRGVVYLPHNNVLAVNNGGSGDLNLYAADSLIQISSITFGSRTGGLRYDAATGRLYLGYDAGHQSGIAILDSNGRPLVQLPLGSHPSGFVVDAAAKRLYVNLPDSREIAVFDLSDDKRLATWPLGIESGTNFPMALDAIHGWLFVATRSPDRLLVLEARTGRILQTLMAPGDVGDLFYNAGTQELYASGGVGRIVVYASGKTGRLLESEDIHTLRGARTSLLDPVIGHYYLAVPAGRGSVAEIRVYVVTANEQGNALWTMLNCRWDWPKRCVWLVCRLHARAMNRLP